MAGEPFLDRGRRFTVTLEVTRGFQLSPFRDGTKSGSSVAVHNLDDGRAPGYALLVPYMNFLEPPGPTR